MVHPGRRNSGNQGRNLPKSACLPKTALNAPNFSILSMPVDKVLNNFFIDWGKLEKLSKGRFLSKFCYGFIQGLPKCLCFRQITDLPQVNQVIHRSRVTLTITTNFINSLDIKLKNARFRAASRQRRQRAGLACLHKYFKLKAIENRQEAPPSLLQYRQRLWKRKALAGLLSPPARFFIHKAPEIC